MADKNFDIYHVHVKGMPVIAYTDNSKIAENAFEEHIKTVLNRDSITGVNVKLYRDLQKYLCRCRCRHPHYSGSGDWIPPYP